jgi:hypothetical protein
MWVCIYGFEAPAGGTMNLKFAVGTLALAAIMAMPGMAKAQDEPDNSTHMVTGCIQKPANSNVYFLLDENGKLWDIHSKTIKFAPHVGHTVTLTGTTTKNSEDQDKKNGDSSPQNHLQVTKLTMVSESCSQKG